MSEFVHFNLEEVRVFARSMDDFAREVEEIMADVESALADVRETWRDRQLDVPAEKILEANRGLRLVLAELCPRVQDFLRREEDWAWNYTHS